MSGRHFAVFGATGTGKTAWIVQHLARERPGRLIVWDYKHDQRLTGVGHPVGDLGALIRGMQSPGFQLRYLVDHDRDLHAQFDLFCRAAWAAGNLTMFVDELPEVTKANKAPPAWRKCVNIGRDYVENGERRSLVIIGAGQRIAECDKSFTGNADVIHCGRLSNVAEAKTLAAAWGVHHTELTTLPNLHWVEKHVGAMEVTRGVLSFGNKAKNISRPKTPPKEPPLRRGIS